MHLSLYNLSILLALGIVNFQLPPILYKLDWISQVLTDIKELGLDLNLEDIKTTKKSNLKIKLNNAVKEKTF